MGDLLGGALTFQTRDGRAQPVFQGFFHLHLVGVTLQAVDRLPLLVEGNEMAGNALFPRFTRHKIGEETLAAFVRARGIVEIQAGSGILKDG